MSRSIYCAKKMKNPLQKPSLEHQRADLRKDPACREPDTVVEVAVDGVEEHGAEPLDLEPAGDLETLSAATVAADGGVREAVDEVDRCLRPEAALLLDDAVAELHEHAAGDDVDLVAGGLRRPQPLEHRHVPLVAPGLLEDLAVADDHRVCGKQEQRGGGFVPQSVPHVEQLVVGSVGNVVDEAAGVVGGLIQVLLEVGLADYRLEANLSEDVPPPRGARTQNEAVLADCCVDRVFVGHGLGRDGRGGAVSVDPDPPEEGGAGDMKSLRRHISVRIT